jgi:hypothetical protein
MQEKVVHIPFNRLFYTESQRNFWAASASKVIQKYTIYTLLGLVCAAAVLTDKSVTDVTVANGACGGFIFYMLIAWIGLFERRAKFLKTVTQHADRYEKEMLDGTFTFNDAGFEYKDNEKTLLFQWHLLKSVTVVKDNMMIALKDPAILTFFLSRRQFGDVEFQELFELLQNKIVK